MGRIRLLWSLSLPPLAVMIGWIAFAGAALSPHFSSAAWSTLRGAGAALVAMMLWLGVAWIHRLFAYGTGPGGLVGLEEGGQVRVCGLPDTISHADLLQWAIAIQAVAFALVLLTGNLKALLLCLTGAGLGNAYSLPCLRLDRIGLVTTTAVGSAVLLVLIGGMLALGEVTKVGLVTAGALGMLAAAMSSIGEFRDLTGDRARGRLTLPILLGMRGAVVANTLLILGAYIAALYLLVHTIGLRRPVIAAMGLLAAVNICLIQQLRYQTEPTLAAKTWKWGLVLFAVVTGLYVGAQGIF